jgi:hypothetical protein
MPLVFVSRAYVSEQRTQQEFSAKERVGLRYLAATTDVLDELIAARGSAVSAAIEGAPSTKMPPPLAAAIDALDAADARDGDELGVRAKWAELRPSVAAVATKAGNPRSVFYGYSVVVDSIFALVTEVGDSSNLILDPDLDSYYVMDALLVQLPRLSDNAGRVADLQHLLETERTDGELAVDRAAYALASARCSAHGRACGEPRHRH